MVTRLISATGDEIKEMSPMDLKESIFKSEGRVVMGQHLLFAGPGLVRGVTNSELMFAFGADMVMLNTFDLDDLDNNPGLCGLSFQELKEKCRRPIGIYLGCPKAGSEDGGKKALYRREGMIASDEHVKKCIELGADFIVLGGNPGSGTSIRDVVYWTKKAREICGEDMLIFAGKWEDGIVEKVLGDPLADYDAKKIIDQLIENGADIIDFPAPGSRHGITVERIRELIEYTHRKGALAMSFLNSNVEAADRDTIREVTLLMKQTGCDVHAIGDGGFGGGTWPENIYQMSVTLKGKAYTWAQMATPRR